MLNLTRYDNTNSKKTNNILNIALTHLTMTYPGFLDGKSVLQLREIISIIRDKNRVGTLSFTLSMLSNSNTKKNLLTMEACVFNEKLQKEWSSYSKERFIQIKNI